MMTMVVQVMEKRTGRMYNMTVRSGCSCAAVRPRIETGLWPGPRE